MQPFQKSNSKLTLIHGVTLALVTSFATPALADNRYEGGLGIERQKVERSQGRQQTEHRQERREERHVDRHQGRHERHRDHHMDRHERHRDHRVYRTPAWRGDMRHFERHDLPRWRGGAWRHARHEGRLGWWWVVGGGSWYFYSQPVYPYPNPYVPPEYFYSQPEYPYFDTYIPPVVIMQSELVESTPDIVVAPAAASQYWYYCESTNGYYPYTASCPEGWKAVLATPPPAQ